MDKINLNNEEITILTGNNGSGKSLIRRQLTSLNTLRLIKGVVNEISKSEEKCFLIFDEFEIGCSEETVLALIIELNEILKELKTKNIGVLVITHSRLVVERLNNDHFINLEGKKQEEWLNRNIEPTDLNKLRENDLFKAIQNRMKEKS